MCRSSDSGGRVTRSGLAYPYLTISPESVRYRPPGTVVFPFFQTKGWHQMAGAPSALIIRRKNEGPMQVRDDPIRLKNLVKQAEAQLIKEVPAWSGKQS